MLDTSERISIGSAPPAPQAPESLPIPFEPMPLVSIEVDQELANTYSAAVTLRNRVLNDSKIPANQQAQVLNSVRGLLTDLSKLRTDLYNAERMRKIEAALIKTLKRFPELDAAFIEEYGRALEDC